MFVCVFCAVLVCVLVCVVFCLCSLCSSFVGVLCVGVLVLVLCLFRSRT